MPAVLDVTGQRFGRLVAVGDLGALTGVLFDVVFRPSLDRIDSAIGYRKTNVQLVLADVNRMKSDLVLELFVKRCKQVADYAMDKTTS